MYHSSLTTYTYYLPLTICRLPFTVYHCLRVPFSLQLRRLAYFSCAFVCFRCIYTFVGVGSFPRAHAVLHPSYYRDKLNYPQGCMPITEGAPLPPRMRRTKSRPNQVLNSNAIVEHACFRHERLSSSFQATATPSPPPAPSRLRRAPVSPIPSMRMQ